MHRTESFECGVPELNDFLRSHALVNQSGGSSRTFVVASPNNSVVGFYSLASVSVLHHEVPERVKKGQPRHPIPGILMARFAVDTGVQGKGLGKALFRDAMLRVLGIAEEIGVRVFIVDAKNDSALAFYSRYGGMSAPQDPYRLYWLMKDVRALI